MKIGILTFHRAHNYGAVLQCYALQEVLKRMGHDVEIIDYRQPWTEVAYRPFSFRFMRTRCHSVKQMMAYVISAGSRYVHYKTTQRNYSDFRKNNLNVGAVFKKSDVANYDACIIGSDQLWGMSCLGWKLDDLYLGNIEHSPTCKIIGYAISSNKFSIDYMHTNGLLDKVVTNFNALSFRETEIKELISAYTGQEFEQCLDPTLLTDCHIWLPLLNNEWGKKKYVACYRARGNGNTGFSVEETAIQLAKKIGCEVIDLSSNKYGVEDFISIIAHAQYVVTTSFHATVFSLIFKRNLATYVLNDGHDSRYLDLLNKLNATSLLYDVETSPAVNPEINWDLIEDNLNKIRENSNTFLSASLHDTID